MNTANTAPGIGPCAVVEPDRPCPDTPLVDDPIPLCRRHAVRVAMRVTDALYASALAAANTTRAEFPPVAPSTASIDEPTTEERALRALRRTGPDGTGPQALARVLTAQGHHTTRRRAREWIDRWTVDGRVSRVVDGGKVRWVHHTHLPVERPGVPQDGPRTEGGAVADTPRTRDRPDARPATVADRIVRLLADGPMSVRALRTGIDDASPASVSNALTGLRANGRVEQLTRGVWQLVTAPAAPAED